MKIIKYLLDKKYRKIYTENIIENFNYNLNQYEKIYKNLRKSTSQVKCIESTKQSA